MNRINRLAVAAALVASAFLQLKAEGTCYMSVGILPVKYLEFPGPDADVRIMRLNLIAGCHRSMYGLDVGTVGNWTTGDMGGIILAGGYNVCRQECVGFQLSCLNLTEGAHYGMQSGVVNTTWGVRGLQVGLVNATGEGIGTQIGLYNVAESFSGLQIGLINMNMASPLLMMPFMNVWF